MRNEVYDDSSVEVLKEEVQKSRNNFESVLQERFNKAKKTSDTGILSFVAEDSSLGDILDAYSKIGYDNEDIKCFIPITFIDIYYEKLFTLNNALALPELAAERITLESSLQEINKDLKTKNTKLFEKIKELELKVTMMEEAPVPQKLRQLSQSQNLARKQYIQHLNVKNDRFDHRLALQLLDQCLLEIIEGSLDQSSLERYIQTTTALDTKKSGVAEAIKGFAQIVSNILIGNFQEIPRERRSIVLEYHEDHNNYMGIVEQNVTDKPIVELSAKLNLQGIKELQCEQDLEDPKPDAEESLPLESKLVINITAADRFGTSLDGHDRFAQSNPEGAKSLSATLLPSDQGSAS